MNVLVLVHPGSFWGSAKAQVDSEIFADAEESLLQKLRACDSLVVIDGFLSEGLPPRAMREINAALERCATDGIALRVWGCDSGERPYPDWQDFPRRSGFIHGSQMLAADAFAPMLAHAGPIELAGAWASKGESGCVNAVRDRLQACHLLGQGITIAAEAAIFEEDIADWEGPDEP